MAGMMYDKALGKLRMDDFAKMAVPAAVDGSSTSAELSTIDRNVWIEYTQPLSSLVVSSGGDKGTLCVYFTLASGGSITLPPGFRRFGAETVEHGKPYLMAVEKNVAIIVEQNSN